MMGAATEKARLPRFIVLGIESCCEVDDLSGVTIKANPPALTRTWVTAGE